MLRQFDYSGLPHWFMLLTGAIEMSAATMLPLPRSELRALGASQLAVTMSGGAAFHLIFHPPRSAIPATILAAITAFIAASTIRNRGAA